MELDFASTIRRVFSLLSGNSKLTFLNSNQISTSGNTKITIELCNDFISILGVNILSKLVLSKNKLNNIEIDFGRLQHLVQKLSSVNSVVRLNHIGFCYKVSSIEEEKKYLLSNIRGNNLHYYQEPSNNEDAWLFLGNKLFWSDPTIEFILVEKIVEKDSDYWMPHIQIDLDTTLTSKEIIELISEVYSKKITPFPIVIDGITYIERCFLGRVDGINIFLDLATNARNVKLLKEQVWKEIS